MWATVVNGHYHVGCMHSLVFGIHFVTADMRAGRCQSDRLSIVSTYQAGLISNYPFGGKVPIKVVKHTRLTKGYTLFSRLTLTLHSTHNLDPSVVGSANFGQLWVANLPGAYRGYSEQLYSQSLVYTLNDGIQYVFIATTQNNIYKLNAKTGAIVASRNLHVPFLTADLDGCVDINPTVGATASRGHRSSKTFRTDSA